MLWLRNKKINFLLGILNIRPQPPATDSKPHVPNLLYIFLRVSLGGGLLPNSGTVMGTVDWVCILISSWKSLSESGANLTA